VNERPGNALRRNLTVSFTRLLMLEINIGAESVLSIEA
jgi:hypothetical protein